MIKYPDNYRPTAENYYFIVCNKQLVAPQHTALYHNYWTAETIVQYLDEVNPFAVFEIVQAEYVACNALWND